MRLVADTRCALGEGPVWNPHDGKLYWTDIEGGAMYRIDPGDHSWEQFYSGPAVSGIAVHDDGGLLLFGLEGKIWSWRDGRETVVNPGLEAERNGRFNDIYVDPAGRVFAGTIPVEGKARLYRLELNRSLTLLLEDDGLANGMDLSPDGRSLYFTDTKCSTIWLFDYDLESGSISGQRPFAVVTDEGHHPDGLAVDEEGCVWSARYGGGCVVRYNPAGEEIERHDLPVRRVTSCAFVDSRLYITTAAHGNERDEEHAGGLFCFDAGVRARPQHRARIRPS